MNSTKADRKGLIFNIQRFSIHDGPGIRTTVFMKGCPLRCEWCSNPESQDPTPTLMVRDATCTACGACAEACPRGAIRIEESARRVDWNRCDQCFECVDACLYGSLKVSGEYMTASSVLDEVRKDEAFYRNSGGGVTVSGGEPLSQGEFVAHLLELCKQEGFHTALDTTAYAPWPVMSKVLRHVDLVLFDLKHVDTAEHLRRTGVPNELILENLAKAAARTTIWLRIPLIPGFNDSEEQIERVASLGKACGAAKISLLPYHEGGKTKSEQIGRPYRWSGGAAPMEEHVRKLAEIIEGFGIAASVGS
ncbi:MAG: glycyl-radical enzyme activating protein [Deltaproteobacteria bacterium]